MVSQNSTAFIIMFVALDTLVGAALVIISTTLGQDWLSSNVAISFVHENSESDRLVYDPYVWLGLLVLELVSLAVNLEEAHAHYVVYRDAGPRPSPLFETLVRGNILYLLS